MIKTTWLICLFISSVSLGQIPAGYYDDTENLEGESLRQTLHLIIDNHDVQSYNSLWTHFESTDQKPNNQVWDMYSDNPDGAEDYVFNFGSDQCGNYGGEGDCYNREHSFPKSWFGNQSPMNSDLFHLYPTDGYVNGIRANYPFGEVGSATYTSANGSKRGDCIYPGYSQVVFEPIDEYKGDFARSYFYMLTRYKDQISNWNSPMLSGDDFSTWAKNLLLEWAEFDPVSQKEIDRNNEVHDIQDNRNPFIDHPEFVSLIWGDPECLFYDCGCTEPDACNYEPSAQINSNDCDYSCFGCTDGTACNYNPEAEVDDSSCILIGDHCEGEVEDNEVPYISEECECGSIPGCTDQTACNYDPEATLNDGSCYYLPICLCVEDIDQDGFVATNDLLILIGNFGCSGDCGSSDLDYNDQVNTSDLLILLSVFGQGCEY